MLRQMVLSAVRCRVVSATTTQRASLSSAAQQEAPNDTSIYEYRTYSIKPESYPSFLALTNEHIHRRLAHSKLVFYGTTEIGGVNEVVHLWQYESLAQRQRVREALVKDAPWMNEYMARMRPMLQRQENLLLRPLLPMQTFGKAPSAPPAPEVTAASGPVVYELKFHAIAPAEWVRLSEEHRNAVPQFAGTLGVYAAEVGHGLPTVFTVSRWPSFDERSRVLESAQHKHTVQAFEEAVASRSRSSTSKLILPLAFSPSH